MCQRSVRLHAMQESFGSRGTSGSVATGEEAALPAVAYQLGYALRDVGVDFQVCTRSICAPATLFSSTHAGPEGDLHQACSQHMTSCSCLQQAVQRRWRTARCS